MNRSKLQNTPHTSFEIHQVNSTGKIRDSPTSSILKTPTAIFVTTRSSSAKTKRLKFANGPVDLLTLRNGSHESSVSLDSGIEASEDTKLNNNGTVVFESSIVEVAISPAKTMQVSPDSWKAFLEYKKYRDYANETEKTDYTYSRLSKYRHKEIIPGFLVRPNLSRSSISSSRSSISLPSSGRSSFNDSSYISGSYEFKIHSEPNSKLSYDFKIPNQPNKFTRSKYYLRSSTFDGAVDTGETESKSNYGEKNYYSESTPEKLITKSVAYETTSDIPESTTRYYGKLRSLSFDDDDIDEVDDNVVQYDKRYYGSNAERSNVWSQTPSAWFHQNKKQSVSQYVGNFFTTMFLYVTSVGTVTKDLFSKYVLRRQDDLSQSSPAWMNEKLGYATASGSWVPWSKDSAHLSKGYYSGGYYYGAHRNWYQRIFDYFSDRFSVFTNFIRGNTAGYPTPRYHETSSRKRFWWLLLPLLLLAGSFLGYIDFFSNPKTILNTMYNWLLFVPSFLQYTVMVFIPRLIFEVIPYFFLTAIPNFVTVTLPYFITQTIPYLFFGVVHFFASISIAGIWNMLVGAFNFIANLTTGAGVALYNLLYFTLATCYSLSSNYLMLFYSNFCTSVFSLASLTLDYVVVLFDGVQHAFDWIRALF